MSPEPAPLGPTSPSDAPAPPTRLGRYELLGQLATGGMAEIHLARLDGEAGFEKIVVVKRLLPELVASKAFVAMFLDEGRLVARLDHPNVCEVHELGREGAEYFLVMPYLDGVPVSEFVARPRETDTASRLAQLRVAAGIVVQACAGMHHAHELRGADGAPLGLVHRDVSPSNLFVTTAGVVKVLDFGVAKVRGAAETEAGTIKGKTQYMAPEQLLGEALDRRCDVFALGIVLFELATHTRLFKRTSDYLAARAILEEAIPRADAADPAVPAPLAEVIGKALARAKGDRFADARELGRAIEAAFASHGGVSNADQIADALADWHGAELSALRTRQLAVIDHARTTLAAESTRGGTPSNVATRQRTVGDLATRQRSVDEPPSNLLGQRHALRRKRLAIVATLGAVVAAAAMIVTLVVPSGGSRTPHVALPPALDATAQVAVAPEDPTGPGDRTASAESEPGAAVEVVVPTTDERTPLRIASSAKPTSNRPPPAAGMGLVSIDSTPFAMIFVDGKYFGTTPLLKKKLEAGRHELVAKLKDGRSKDLRVDISPGKLAPPIVLSW